MPKQAPGEKGSQDGTQGTSRTWDWDSFREDLGSRRGSDLVRVAQSILEWAESRGLRPWWGHGLKQGSFFPVIDCGPIAHSTVAVWTYGSVEVQFQTLKARPPFDDEAKRLELLHRLNDIPGVSIPETEIGHRPSFPLSALVEEQTQAQFLAVLNWVLDEIRSSS